jgi:hypothetical protein
MATIRYRDRESSATGALFVAVGALAGLATGVLLAQRYGGLSAISQRVRDRLGDAAQHEDEDEARFGPSGHDVPEYDDEPLGDDADEGEMLEERVLEAFRNDPVLSERAIDIGAIGTGIIELTGWVHAEDETHHAVTVTRGVPGVETVVNRLTVREEEERYDERGRRYRAGDEETSPRWEGMGIAPGAPPGVPRTSPTATPTRSRSSRSAGRASSRRSAPPPTTWRARRAPPVDRVGGDGPDRSAAGGAVVPKGDHVADPASDDPVLARADRRSDRNLRGD